MRQLPPLNALRAFEAAARLNSLTLAAVELNVTRAAVSQQVKQLEHFLDAKLFERNGTKLLLTEEAQYYLPLLTQSFDALSRGTQHLFERNKKQTLTLRVANSFAQQWLIPRLDDFLRKYPNIDIKMLTTTNSYPQKNGGVDIEIINGYGQFQHHNATPLFDEEWLVVASPSFIKKQGMIKDDLDSIASCKKIAVFGYQESWQDWFLVQEYDGEIHTPHLQFEHSQLGIEAAIQGLGALYVRSLLVEDALKQGELVRVSSFELPSQSQHYLIVNTDGDLGADWEQGKVKAFSGWLLDGCHAPSFIAV
ncbi:LysR substrate-binding domain-containing protein [Vibrio tapetis subsp. quintayensis]|uniref:LysR substrate-binding domain-containing protein n=1 Tax=Vibrio tapetis TaxID=52443 RepID=UPI0025B5634D|nr:LysR substrate-binding domain-containing protein [Vibrio tapetis]MDN3681973.1 LysR substrate-binding domain-containing protein [Vibrio tapetis subsp. quintayensis]